MGNCSILGEDKGVDKGDIGTKKKTKRVGDRKKKKRGREREQMV